MLAQLLQLAGIESVVLEARSREHVEQRVRAGVLEQGTVDLLDAAGVGERMRREGLVHHGIELQFDGERHRIPLSDLAGGRTIVVYGQTEVVKDLIAARLASGRAAAFRGRATSPCTTSTASAARPLRARGPPTTELECDFIAGCDGFHGVCRASIPEGALRTFSRDYPFGWLGILAAVAPSSDELDLRPPRARLRAAQPALARAEPAVRAVPARRGHRRLVRRPHLGRAAAAARPRRLDARGRPGPREGRDRDAQLRRRAHAPRASLPGRRRGAHRAAHRRQGPQPGDRRRARARRGARRAGTTSGDGAARRLLGDMPAPCLARRALLLVDDLHAAPLARGRPVRAEAAALAAAQRRQLARRRDGRWPRTTSVCERV